MAIEVGDTVVSVTDVSKRRWTVTQVSESYVTAVRGVRGAIAAIYPIEQWEKVESAVSDQGTEPSSVAHALLNGFNGVRANRVFIDEVGEFPDAAEIYRQASQVEEWPGESYGD